MATTAPPVTRTKVARLREEQPTKLYVGQRNRLRLLLNFPQDLRGMRTRFRETVFNYIYRTALGLFGDRLKSAVVSLSDSPDEEDSLVLHLTMAVNADWEAIEGARYEVLENLGIWSEEWTEAQKKDFGRFIYFGFIPTDL